MKKLVLGFLFSVFGLAFLAVPTFASGTVVYDALPSISPLTNYPSQPFQAQQTSEFGDYIHLGGSARVLNTVTVTMSDWALYSQYSADSRYSANNVSWTHPITLNIYNNHLGTNGAPDQKIASVTQTITIPWRPAENTACPLYGGVHGWETTAGDTNTCVNGVAFNATFDLSSLHVNLPNDIIIGVAFNTQSYGANPIGTNGPYNSLNVAVPPHQPVSIGTDDNTDAVFWNTSTCSYYTDSNSAAQCNAHNYGLYLDTNWTPNGTVAFQVTAVSNGPTDMNQCKNNGWKNFSNPSFKNQGDCVSFVQSNVNAGKRSAQSFSAANSTYYNCSTECGSIYGTGPINFTWDPVTGNVTGGSYNEVVSGTTYYNNVTGGSVSGNTVNLTFSRTNPNSYSFTFTGTLINNVLSGQLDGPYYFTATGN